MPRCFVQPMKSSTINIPAMTIGDHSTSLYGGFIATYKPELGTLTQANYTRETYDQDKLMDIQRRQFAGDLSGYADLVTHYNQNRLSVDRMARLYNQGWQFYQREGKSICYHAVKGEFEVESALKAGLLR